MNPQFIPFWQSILMVGKTILPYVGLFLLIVFGILMLLLVAYLLYRFARRMPIFFRHLSWRCITGFRRLISWLRRGRSGSQPTVMACFTGSSKPAAPLQYSFSTTDKFVPWAKAVPIRPADPLFLVLGFEGSGKSSLLALGGQAQFNPKSPASSICELTWWRLEHGWALELNQALCVDHGTKKFTHMLRILEQMCPSCPVDGLIVVLTAKQLLDDISEQSAVTVLAKAAASIASQLGDVLPIQLVITHANSLNGFEELLRLRTATGQRQATLGTRLPLAKLETPRQQTTQLLRGAIQGQVLQALSMQTASSNNFNFRTALRLPTEIDGLKNALVHFENQLSADSAAIEKPWLQSVALTGLVRSASKENFGELVFAGPDLRNQLFLKNLTLQPRKGHIKQGERNRNRAAVINFACLASCIALLLWTSVTWTGIDQQLSKVNRLINDLRPELSVARNPSVASLGSTSIERLLQSVSTLDQTKLVYVLVPSSWFSDLREDALMDVGEIMNRTMIQERSIQLATDFPQVNDTLLPPSGAVGAQRIEELPAYQELIAFLDARELFAMSINSGQKLNHKISYKQFQHFMGIKPEHKELSGIDLNDAMPLAVTQRFRIKTLKSPANDAQLRQTIEIYWERLVTEALELHPIVVLSDQVQEEFQSASNGVFNISDARRLETVLKKFKHEAALPSARRIFSNKKDALVFFAPAQLRLGLSSVISSEQTVDLVSFLDNRFESLRTTLLQKETEGAGVLFVADAREGSLQLSPDFKRLSNAYTSFMSQPFMRLVDSTPFTTAGSTQYLEWKLSEVEPARYLAESFREYSTGGSQVFDPNIKSSFMRLARSNYMRQIDAIFLSAARLRELSPLKTQTEIVTGLHTGGSGLRELSMRATNLAAVGKLYRQLQPIDSTASPLSSVNEQLIRESNRLLERLEVVLYQEDPYATLITAIASWLSNSSSEKILANSFTGNTKELLVSPREYVRAHYAAAALPLLEYLTAEASKTAPNDTVLRWAKLREVLDSFEKGNLNNGIYELERYVLSLSKLREANECVTFLQERQSPVPRGDYFSKQLINLDETVSAVCQQRIHQSQRSNYEIFAKWFNSNIAGRPPFSHSSWNGNHAALTAQQFERLLSRYSEFRKSMLTDNKNDNNWPSDVGLFIAHMDRLTAFFLPAQNPSKLATRNDEVRLDTPFRARLEFRSNRNHEAGADQIIDLSISNGARRYTNRGNDIFQWKIGEPVEVLLRWAADSPESPLGMQSKIYNYSANERIASFKYSGDWALFEMLDKHKSSLADPDRGVALLFPIPTMGPKGRQIAKLFISLHSPDGINALDLHFPKTAPMYLRNGRN